MVVVDDALLLDILAGTAAPQLLEEARGRREVATTGSWYWRAGRAVAGGGHGALSRRVETLPEAAQRLVREGMNDLPPEIGLVSPRTH